MLDKERLEVSHCHQFQSDDGILPYTLKERRCREELLNSI